jgi:toxin ParE1/3/4
MAEAIERRVGRLAEMPRLGRTGRVEGTRELVIPDTPFLAVYELEGDQESVVILRILHSARRWPGPAR